MSDEMLPGTRRLDLSALTLKVAETLGPFLHDVIRAGGERLIAVEVVGSALTSDFSPSASDINTVVILERIERPFLDALAGLGRRHGAAGIEAPLLMTPDYVKRSLDVFPLEFLSFAANHVSVYGGDHFAGLQFDRAMVRLGVERELKSLLVNLHRGYIRSLGRPSDLHRLLVSSVNSLVPVFAAVLHLRGADIPAGKAETVAAGAKVMTVDPAPFEDALRLRNAPAAPPLDRLKTIFEGLHNAIETLAVGADSM